MHYRPISCIPLVVIAIALIGLGLWSANDRERGLSGRRSALDAIIAYHEAIVGEMFRIDAGLRWNFDTLAVLERNYRDQIDLLESQALIATPTNLAQVLRSDLELVERYKTHHAVRRKSLAVFVEFNAEEAAFPERFAREIPWLVMQLSSGRDRHGAADKINTVLEDEHWLDSRHVNAKAHLQLIVQSQMRCEAILEQLVSSTAPTQLLRASDRLRERIQSQTAVLETRQGIMLILLAALLGYAGAMLIEQRRAVRDLALVNDGLESAVEARTSELAAERKLLRSLLDSLPAAVYWKDLDGVYRGCNPAFAGLFGFEHDKRVVGITDDDLSWDPDTRADEIAMDRSVLETLSPMIEKPVRKTLESGRGYEMIASKTILSDEEDCARGIVGVYTDVTELNRLRGELAQAEKLRSVGQLAAGIAHEINSPLQTASNNIEYLKDGLEMLLEVAEVGVAELLENRQDIDPRRVEHLCKNVDGAIVETSEALRRVTEIVRAMRVVSHPGKQRHIATDLNSLIDSAVMLTRNRWKSVATLEFDADPDLPEPEVLTNEISQTMLNLLVNAGDAIADSRGEDDPLGLITVRTLSEYDNVVIEIQDNGCGMPAEVRAKIFEPFFTTKDVGKGTGQGLAIAHAVVVEGHNGQIECDSEPGVGTTFRLSLPITAKHASTNEDFAAV